MFYLVKSNVLLNNVLLCDISSFTGLEGYTRDIIVSPIL